MIGVAELIQYMLMMVGASALFLVALTIIVVHYGKWRDGIIKDARKGMMKNRKHLSKRSSQ